MSELPFLDLAASVSALVAAQRTGLIDALASGGTAEELAAGLELTPEAVRSVLEVLTALGFVERDAGRYQATPQLLLELGGPRGALLLPLFGHGETFLRTGRPLFEGSQSSEARGATYAKVVGHLADRFSEAAQELAGRLADLPTPAHVLDVGAGSAVWSLAMAERHPETRVTALDLPRVLPNAQARAEALGLADRFDTLASDYHAVELAAGRYDRIVVANVLHLEVPERALAVLRRLAPALAPGGRFVIVDAMVTDDPSLALRRAAYAYFLALRVEGGYPHSEATLRSWLRELGRMEATRVDLDGPPRGMSALLA